MLQRTKKFAVALVPADSLWAWEDANYRRGKLANTYFACALLPS